MPIVILFSISMEAEMSVDSSILPAAGEGIYWQGIMYLTMEIVDLRVLTQLMN